MHYFDTSFLTPLIREEKTSARVAAFIARLPAGELAISRWTEVEFSSLLARDVRMKSMMRERALAAEALFAETVSGSFEILMPSAADYKLARQFLQRYETGLRAGDALHLAIASNNGAEAIYCLDQIMVKAGKTLDLPVSSGI